MSLHWLGDNEESNEIARDLLERQRRVLGERSVDVLSTYQLIGSNHYFQREMDQALEHFHEATQLGYELLGEDDPAVLHMEIKFVECMDATGFSETAIEIGERCLEKHLRVHGEDHEGTIYLVEALGRIKERSGASQGG